MRKHLLAIAVILTVATGCDNVAWGGIDVELKPPPESQRVPDVVEEVVDDAGPVNVNGPLLLAGVRDDARADFVLMGELLDDGLHPFPDPTFPEDADRLAAATAVGSDWVLFSEGVRVGRMTVDATAPAPAYCGGRTQLSGVLELTPAASTAERFFAIPEEDGRAADYGSFEAHAHTFNQRVASLNIGGDLLRRYEAPWPADTLRYARHDIQSFQLPGASGPSVVATFLHQDALSVGRPRQGAYALFLMAEPVGGQYREAFDWFRSVDTEGKGAPRYFGHFDLDGDGAHEIVLDVFGADRRWFAALTRRDGEWVRAYQDACGSGSTTN